LNYLCPTRGTHNGRCTILIPTILISYNIIRNSIFCDLSFCTVEFLLILKSRVYGDLAYYILRLCSFIKTNEYNLKWFCQNKIYKYVLTEKKLIYFLFILHYCVLYKASYWLRIFFFKEITLLNYIIKLNNKLLYFIVTRQIQIVNILNISQHVKYTSTLHKLIFQYCKI